LKTNKVIISQDVLFDGKAKWNWQQSQLEDQFVSVSVFQQRLAQGNASNDDSTHPSSRTPSAVSYQNEAPFWCLIPK
jgi:hypothetical protein